MGFDSLPEFPQGGVARADSGNMGIPPESFQQALRDRGVDLIESGKRPEDNPAVARVLSAEVDALAAQMGLAIPPSPQQPGAPPAMADTRQVAPQMAPARPADTAHGPAAPRVPDADLRAKIDNVMRKYDSPEAIAKAYVHADAARTRAQMERSNDITALRGEIAQVRDLLESRNAGAFVPPNQAGQGFDTGFNPQAPEEDEYLKKTRAIVNDVVKTHLTAFADAQRRSNQDRSFRSLREQRQADIKRLEPFMDEIYIEERDIFDSLPKDRALDLLIKRAKEREGAYKGELYHQDMKAILEGDTVPGAAPNGSPAGGAGAVPNAGGTARRVEPGSPTNGDWSRTPAFEKLWKARSDSREEDMAVVDILAERGFGNHLT